MNILELLEGIIRKPADTLKLIAREKPVGWALVIFAVIALLGSLTVDYSSFEQIVDITPPNIFIRIAGALGGFFVMAGLLHLVSRLFKGTGDYWALFSALGFAQFPGILNPVAELIKRVGGTAGVVLGGVLSLGSGIWVLVLWVIALRESREITTGASVLSLLLVILGIVVLFLIVAVLIIMALGASL